MQPVLQTNVGRGKKKSGGKSPAACYCALTWLYFAACNAVLHTIWKTNKLITHVTHLCVYLLLTESAQKRNLIETADGHRRQLVAILLPPRQKCSICCSTAFVVECVSNVCPEIAILRHCNSHVQPPRVGAPSPKHITPTPPQAKTTRIEYQHAAQLSRPLGWKPRSAPLVHRRCCWRRMPLNLNTRLSSKV